LSKPNNENEDEQTNQSFDDSDNIKLDYSPERYQNDDDETETRVDESSGSDNERRRQSRRSTDSPVRSTITNQFSVPQNEEELMQLIFEHIRDKASPIVFGTISYMFDYNGDDLRRVIFRDFHQFASSDDLVTKTQMMALVPKSVEQRNDFLRTHGEHIPFVRNSNSNCVVSRTPRGVQPD
jgi:hypothetical protein